IRYSELRFLLELSKSPAQDFYDHGGDRSKALGLSPRMYAEMAAALVEDLYVSFDRDDIQLIVAKLRRELSSDLKAPGLFQDYQWKSPRQTIQDMLSGLGPGVQRLRLTYRGLRRIEELRDLLRHDRILEHFGILLDLRYALPDLVEA